MAGYCIEILQEHNKKVKAMNKQLKTRERTREPFRLLSKRPIPSHNESYNSTEEQTQLIETGLQRSLHAQPRQSVY